MKKGSSIRRRDIKKRQYWSDKKGIVSFSFPAAIFTKSCQHLLYSALHVKPEVTTFHTWDKARNLPQNFNMKSISRNTTLRQSYHLQAMLTGVKCWTDKTRAKKANNLKNEVNKSQHQLRQSKLEITSFLNSCVHRNFQLTSVAIWN